MRVPGTANWIRTAACNKYPQAGRVVSHSAQEQVQQAMPKYYERDNGRIVEYDLRDASCPTCAGPVVGYFREGQLVKV